MPYLQAPNRPMNRTLSLLLAPLLLLTSLSMRSQVFIPNQLERDWLNAAIPGIVDAGGIMDTLHPSIAELDSAEFIGTASSPEVELVGLPYLDSLRLFRVRSGEGLTIERLPDELTDLWILSWWGPITLGSLPSTLENLALHMTAGVTATNPPIHIASLPDTLNSLSFVNAGPITVGNSGHIRVLQFNEPNTQSTILPDFDVGILYLNYVTGSMDMSAMTANRVDFNHSTFLSSLRWPSHVRHIYMPHVPTSLPPWPSTLESLVITYGNNACLPVFPEGLSILGFTFMPSCIPNWPTALDDITPWGGDVYTEETATYCSVLNSTCPGVYPALAGKVLMDLNNNGTADEGEPVVPSAVVSISPGGHSAGCEVDGSWEIGVPPGDQTITAANDYAYATGTTPTAHSASVPLGGVDLDNNFAVSVVPDIQDLRVRVSALPARPGFNNQVHLRCENYGTTPVNAQLTFTFDADQSWVSSSLSPASLTANTATWNFPAMPIGAVHNLVVELNTAASVALGTEIIHTLTADPLATDETPNNNVHTVTDSVVGSYDPNDKLLSPSAMSPDQVAAGATPIEYTIRFQNTGTFLAERVVIVDTLSEDLQWSSMRFIASSHAHQWYITDGVLHVIHNNIMLPDSTSDEPGSHGFFSFSMLPATDLQDGATVSNIAHIVFDFNEPIITPPAIFQVDVEARLTEHTGGSSLRLVPNPAHDRLQVRGEGTALLRYRIIDVLGAQVQVGTLAPNGWVTLYQLAEGPYVMEVEQAGVISSQRFVKQ